LRKSGGGRQGMWTRGIIVVVRSTVIITHGEWKGRLGDQGRETRLIHSRLERKEKIRVIRYLDFGDSKRRSKGETFCCTSLSASRERKIKRSQYNILTIVRNPIYEQHMKRGRCF
jgi:hypothetical protein